MTWITNIKQYKRMAIFAISAALFLTCVTAHDAAARENYRSKPVVVKERVTVEEVVYAPSTPRAVRPMPYGMGAERVDYGATCYSTGFHDPTRTQPVSNIDGVQTTGGYMNPTPMRTGIGRPSIPVDFGKNGPSHLRQQSRSERLPAPVQQVNWMAR